MGSLGGGAVIVFAFSSWLGKVWAKRILEKEKHQYAAELERIKTELKLQLEITKSVTLRYSENQFSRYNELWMALCNLKQAGENLWDQATRKNLSHFARELTNAEGKVDQSFLFVEEDHYRGLKKNCLRHFGTFNSVSIISWRFNLPVIYPTNLRRLILKIQSV